MKNEKIFMTKCINVHVYCYQSTSELNAKRAHNANGSSKMIGTLYFRLE